MPICYCHYYIVGSSGRGLCSGSNDADKLYGLQHGSCDGMSILFQFSLKNPRKLNLNKELSCVHCEDNHSKVKTSLN